MKAAIMQVIETYPSPPRGNRQTVHLGRCSRCDGLAALSHGAA